MIFSIEFFTFFLICLMNFLLYSKSIFWSVSTTFFIVMKSLLVLKSKFLIWPIRSSILNNLSSSSLLELAIAPKADISFMIFLVVSKYLETKGLFSRFNLKSIFSPFWISNLWFVEISFSIFSKLRATYYIM